MIHHACPKCEELQIEVDWLRRAMGVELDQNEVASVRGIVTPRLEPYEARFLLILHGARGRVVTTDLLEQRLPPKGNGTGERVDDTIFKVYVCRLRRKLGKDAIETVYAQGYRLAPAMIARLDALFGVKAAA